MSTTRPRKFRVAKLSPPGARCSVALMKNDDAAGSVQGLHLMVTDLPAAHAELVERGVGSGRSTTSVSEGSSPGSTRTAPPSPPSPTSPTRTGTAGCCRSAARACRR